MDDEQRLALAELAIEGAEGSLEAVVFDTDLALTRFTKNAIHQNLAGSEVTVQFRAVHEGRAGTASTNARDRKSLRAARERALAQTRFAPKPQLPIELPGPARYQPPQDAFDPATASAPPQARASATHHVFAAAAQAGAWAAGYVSTKRDGIAIANSHGLRASFASTGAAINVKCIAPEASGYAEGYSRRLSDLDATAIAERAAAKARDAGTPRACDVGEWTLLLEPAAAGELLHYLLPHFSAQRVDEGASFLADGLGKTYAGPNVTLVDDYAHPLHAGRPFDTEGSPTQRVVLLDQGIGRDFVTDMEWAARLSRPNTGHYAPELAFADGPQPRYPVVMPGERSRDELIASIERGILVSRFWYIRVVDQRRTIVTGMTRDGTFLIEKGKITGGLRNLRFNVSILDLLRACEFSNEQVRSGGHSYEIVVPAMRFDRFAFSSVTAF